MTNHRQTLCMAVALATVSIANAAQIARFDFENHTAGPTIASVGTARSTGDSGDQFDFNDNAGASGVTVSQLTVGTGGGGNLNSIGSIVRSDTIAATTPGGNFLEIHPARLDNQSFAADLTPDNGTDDPDYFMFSITPVAGTTINLSNISFDMGIGRGASDTAGLTFRVLPFFSVNGGAWASVTGGSSPYSTGSFTSSQAFSGFVNRSDSLSGVSALQGLTDTDVVEFALSMSDNTGRSLFSASATNPAGHYLDNILVEGTIIPEPSISLLALVSIGLLGRRRR